MAQFSPGIKLSVLVMCVLPILASLGFWQLDRAEQKRQILEAYETTRYSQPIGLDESSGLVNYQPVSLIGKYDGNRWFLRDNQLFEGRVGYEVISPFKLQSGLTVMISRGWVQGFADRTQLPNVETPSGTLALTGYVYEPLKEPILLGNDIWNAGWPKVIQATNFNALAEVLKVPVYPRIVRLDEGMPGMLMSHWVVVASRPEKHSAYALQWFTMAFSVFILFLWVGFKQDNESS